MKTPAEQPDDSLDLLHRPATALLAIQLLAILVYPFLETSRWGSALLGVFSMLAVGLAVMLVRRSAALTVVAVAFGFPAVVFTVLEAVVPSQGWIVLVGALFHAPFYFYVSYAMVKHVFDDSDVTRDDLFATGTVFTLVAWAFAYVYVVVDHLAPGSLENFTGGQGRFFEALFFSFTNLTSAGLSDILPVGAHARSVVMIEQVAGVLYLALIVTRLVGITVHRRG